MTLGYTRARTGPPGQSIAPRRRLSGRSFGISDILLRAQVRGTDGPLFPSPSAGGEVLVEYGLIIASIAILLIVAMLFLAGKLDNLFSDTGSKRRSPVPLP